MPTALIIDAEPTTCWMLQTVVEAALPDWRVVVAATAIEALDAAASHSADLSLAILDLAMPQLNGYELILRLHSISEAIRIVPIAALDQGEAVNTRLFALGCMAPLFRPVSAANVAAHIARVVEQSPPVVERTPLYAMAEELAAQAEARVRHDGTDLRILIFATSVRDRLGTYAMLHAAGLRYLVECDNPAEFERLANPLRYKGPTVAVLDARDVHNEMLAILDEHELPYIIIGSRVEDALAAAAIVMPDYPRQTALRSSSAIIVAADRPVTLLVAEIIERVLFGESYLSPLLTAPFADTPLNERESKQLALEAVGFDKDEIGDRLGITPESVNTNRHRIIKKLDLKGVPDLRRWVRMRLRARKIL